jgi:hypothetical protein
LGLAFFGMKAYLQPMRRDATFALPIKADGMPLLLTQHHKLLMAERSRDVATITEAIEAVIAVSPETTLLEIDQVFRDAGSPVYLVAKPELTVAIGMPAWIAALAAAGLSPEANRQALAGTTAGSNGA